MHFLPPLAHGALGIWDEVIPVILFIGIGVIALISGILGRNRDENLANPPENLQPKEASNPKADHYRLD